MAEASMAEASMAEASIVEASNAEASTESLTHKSNQSQSYQIYDYTKLEPRIEFTEYKSWVEEVTRLTSDLIVNRSEIYKSRLKILGPLGKYVMFKRGLKNKKFFHTFYVLKSADEKNEKKCEISIEKDQTGIIFQFATEEGVVKKMRQGNVRKNVEDFKGDENDHIQGILVDNLFQITDLLDYYDELSCLYNALRANCQYFTKEVNGRIVDQSKNLEFYLAGSPRKYKLDDPELLDSLKDYYPGWSNEENVQLIPEIQDLFPVDLLRNKSAEYDEEFIAQDHKFFLDKQKIATAISDALENLECKGRKAILSNMSKVAYQKALMLTDNVASTHVQLLSAFWNSELELVLIADELGVIIVSFFEESDEDKSIKVSKYQTVERKNKLVGRIGNFNTETKCIHTINVVVGKINLVEPELNQLCTEFNLTVIVDPKSEEMKRHFQRCLKRLHSEFLKNGHSSTTRDELRSLTAKLIFLQNFESENVIVHKKLTTQEWGIPGLVMWTSEQMEVIKKARNDFSKGILPVVSVTGCYGSGKTMLLVKIVHEFLRSGMEGKVFVRIHDNLNGLKSKVENLLTKDGKLIERIYIGTETQDLDLDDFQILLCEEFNCKDDGILFYFDRIIIDKMKNKSIFLFSTRKSVQDHIEKGFADTNFTQKIKKIHLKGSLRSSMSIAKLAAELMNENPINKIDTEIFPMIKWEKTPPVIRTVDDSSNNRTKLQSEFFTMIEKIDQRVITVVCIMHNSLRKKLQEEWERRKENENFARKKINFFTMIEVVGCEFPCLLVVLDPSTYFPSDQTEIISLTRATTSLHILVNRSKVPITINGRPCVSMKSIIRENLEKEVDAIIKEAKEKGETVGIFDEEDFLSLSFKLERREYFYLGKFDQQMITEYSREKNFFVLIGQGESIFFDNLVPPCIIFDVVSEEQMRELTSLPFDFYDFHRNRIINFFMERETE